MKSAPAAAQGNALSSRGLARRMQSEVLVGPCLKYGPAGDANYMRKHLVSILYLGLILVGLQLASYAQGIVATHTSDGRLIYENADAPSTPMPVTTDSGMVYWSNRENRWKPVPPANSHSGRAAQSAAEEVRRMIRRAARHNPQLATNGGTLMVASNQVQNLRDLGGQDGLEATTKSGNSQSQNQVLATSTPASALATGQTVASVRAPGAPGWIDSIVEQAALRHAVDPNLVRAIIKVESNFNPQAVSRKGAIGLMQLMPRTAKSLNVNNPYDPAQNVDAGVRHFKELLDSYNGNLELSLAAYNAGVTAVHRSGGVPNYSETRNYVKRITGMYGSTTAARMFSTGHPMIFKRDAQGHLSVSDTE